MIRSMTIAASQGVLEQAISTETTSLLVALITAPLQFVLRLRQQMNGLRVPVRVY